MKISLTLMSIFYGAIHALVDFTSAIIIHKTLFLNASQDFTFIFIIYNLIAFGSQFIIGLISDFTGKYSLILYTGLILLIFSLLIVYYFPFTAIIFTGLGNAMFHIGAGATLLKASGPKTSHIGIFVGPGAIGLAFGIWLGKNNFAALGIPVFFLVASILILMFLRTQITNIQIIKSKFSPLIFISIILVCLAISSRSFAGALNYKPGQPLEITLSIAFAACLGKITGGILADAIGWMKASVLAITIAAICLLTQGYGFALTLTGLFFVQMPMSVLMVSLSRILKPGFAFGLSCLAYLIGSLPLVFSFLKIQPGHITVIILFLLYASTLISGIYLLKYHNGQSINNINTLIFKPDNQGKE